jgi:nucleoside-diphosphate-sugar epimerase
LSDVSLNILFIGGTGEISRSCVDEVLRLGHSVTVFNRGRTQELRASGVQTIVGDIKDDATYRRLGAMHFDVVAQFLGFEPADVERDLELFAGHCGQYIFISSASAYEKPCRTHLITEDTPLANPYMRYSRNKAACETVLANAGARLASTVIRPSHTYRERLPSTVIDGNHLAWRLLQDKPVIVHGDGESLWTLTHADDFGRAFAALCGNTAAIGETFHITDSQPHTWNVIFSVIGEVVGKEPTICHITSDRLVAYEEAWRGPLLGDKSNSVVFDNTRVREATGGWHCNISLSDGLSRAFSFVQKRIDAGYQPEPKADATIDRIISEQST